MADVKNLITLGIGASPGTLKFVVLLGLDVATQGLGLTADSRSAALTAASRTTDLTADTRSGGLTVTTRPQ
jgi:hypothetical protein